MNVPVERDFIERMIAFRNSRGLSQRDFAYLVGLTPQTIQRIEEGKTKCHLKTRLRIERTISDTSERDEAAIIARAHDTFLKLTRLKRAEYYRTHASALRERRQYEKNWNQDKKRQNPEEYYAKQRDYERKRREKYRDRIRAYNTEYQRKRRARLKAERAAIARAEASATPDNNVPAAPVPTTADD